MARRHRSYRLECKRQVAQQFSLESMERCETVLYPVVMFGSKNPLRRKHFESLPIGLDPG